MERDSGEKGEPSYCRNSVIHGIGVNQRTLDLYVYVNGEAVRPWTCM